MNELNMAIYTSAESAKVTLTASFASHEDAVRFHDGLARLCRECSTGKETRARWPTRLLTGGSND